MAGPPSRPSPPAAEGAEEWKSRKRRTTTFDWISHPAAAAPLSAFQRFTRDIDWDSSPLGPMRSWPAQLRHMTLLIFADPAPAVVYWGVEATIVYNEPYSRLIGDKHPALQGHDPRVGFAEIWDQFDRLLSRQRDTGLASVEDDAFLLFRRHGFLEETYFSWKFVPIVGDDGDVVGSHATVVEVTRDVIAARRLSTVNALSDEVTAASTIETLWTQILKGLDHADKDIPLALLYSTTTTTTTTPAEDLDSRGPVTCTLRGALGVATGHPLAPAHFDLNAGTWLAESFHRAAESASSIMLQEEDGTLPVDYFDGLAWRGYNVPPSRMIVCPIQSIHSSAILAFLVFALNPRRPYDDDYRGFIHGITAQVLAPHVSAIVLRAEVLQQQKMAKKDADSREELSRELLVRTLEVKHSELRFANFAARVQIGLAIFDKNGSPLYGNEQWESLTQLSVNCSRDDWNAVIVPEDRSNTHKMFDRVMNEGGPLIFQIRLTKPWRAPDLDTLGNPQWTNTCVLCSFFEDLDEDGNLKSIMTTLTDISDLKWVEAQLLRRTVDVERRELMWRNFTGRAPIGLCLINRDGSLEFGNETWWTMTQTSEAEKSDLWGWRKAVLAEDVTKLETVFTDALNQHVDATLEFRLNRFWEGSDLSDEGGESSKNRTTILGTVHTVFNDDSTMRHVVGWFTDISAQKAVEVVLRGRMDEAIEMKRQQERFIDMTSHEMRNPLSAMLHCADEIISILDLYCMVNQGKSVSSPAVDTSVSHLKDAIEAAETIIYCALHQKRIVDDILTLSRLDSELLFISPEPVQPLRLVRHALLMFKAEMKRTHLNLDFQEDISLQDLDVQWVLLDPSRLLQVFINLMTNAIKFTQTETEKHIMVAISASRTKPSNPSSTVHYVARSQNSRDHTLSAEWGEGEIIYLLISVRDTGRGLTDQEKSLLFHAFQQASPKTHVEYGGSGLGLFISRQLVEMQGGAIGVAAEASQGSTFTFYIKTRKTTAPLEGKAAAAAVAAAEIQVVPGEADTAPDSYRDRLSGLNNKTLVTYRDLHSESSPPLDATIEPSTILHVLVVEDNLVNQKVVSKQLRNNKCRVAVANHGQEALDHIRRSEFWAGGGDSDGDGDGDSRERLSIVLMDLEMPVMDGLTCVRTIREWQARGWTRGHVPVIAVTANARKDQIATAMDAGMDDVETKPYRITEMLKRMKKVVSRYSIVNGDSDV